jgi:hypothetical protein
VTALDAYDTAQALADHGRLDSDAVTHADIDAAADLVGAQRPAGSDDRHTVRTALDALNTESVSASSENSGNEGIAL